MIIFGAKGAIPHGPIGRNISDTHYFLISYLFPHGRQARWIIPSPPKQASKEAKPEWDSFSVWPLPSLPYHIKIITIFWQFGPLHISTFHALFSAPATSWSWPWLFNVFLKVSLLALDHKKPWSCQQTPTVNTPPSGSGRKGISIPYHRYRLQLKSVRCGFTVFIRTWD